MKKTIIIASTILLSAGLSLSAFAQGDTTNGATDQTAVTDQTGASGNATTGTGTMQTTQTTTTTSTTTTGKHLTGPCKNIQTACVSAGFTREGGKGKSLWKDCVKPVLTGKTVANVTVDPSDLQACKKKVANRMQKTAAEIMGTSTTNQ